MTRTNENERGSLTLESCILAVGAIVLIGLLVVGMRISWATNAVQSAAASAARDGSLARSADQARNQAATAAAVSMAQSGATCNGQDTSLDTSQFLAPIGQTGKVTVTITCSVPVANLVPGLPGSMSITKSASSPVDPYRQR
ncbi:pilus assembly protein [Arthrobacter cryoconiti]|uniref:Pilus assembly protein n=1 Tax=Arthrobacter cryoconiti TaxID=748907 RepID=A0ABV8R440_9MICC|nr:pilus assembly protein [Arthrobacter cryoconiti]MCC9069356.1 pilus assembly protein [Arthrobacter cryoconiti]